MMLTISNISFAIEGKPLFEGASANIPTGHKVGIVGRNGTGKTTFIRMLAGLLKGDEYAKAEEEVCQSHYSNS